MTMEAARTIVAGWYTDPADANAKRWWDGSQWTSHVRHLPVEDAAPAEPEQQFRRPRGLKNGYLRNREGGVPAHTARIRIRDVAVFARFAGDGLVGKPSEVARFSR